MIRPHSYDQSDKAQAATLIYYNYLLENVLQAELNGELKISSSTSKLLTGVIENICVGMMINNFSFIVTERSDKRSIN